MTDKIIKDPFAGYKNISTLFTGLKKPASVQKTVNIINDTSNFEVFKDNSFWKKIILTIFKIDNKIIEVNKTNNLGVSKRLVNEVLMKRGNITMVAIIIYFSVVFIMFWSLFM